MKSNINLAIVGHMDHGKSTFIGRLLYDSGYVKKYELAALQAEEGQNLDFSHFLDIYKEEREHAMTMDTTKRFFETGRYQFTIIDSPGHKEFIKNMLSGISEAHYAIAVVSCLDTERVQEQTRRHLALLHLLGIRVIAVAVNKMDLVEYSEAKYTTLVHDMRSFLSSVGYDSDFITFIPISATKGENICVQSLNMHWYTGPTIFECLDSVVVPVQAPITRPLRLVVQHTSQEESLLFGRIETGKVTVGDKLCFAPGRIQGLVQSLNVLGKDVRESFAGESVDITLKTNDFPKIVRGAVGGSLVAAPKAYQRALVQIILPFDMTLKTGDELLFRSSALETKVVVADIVHKIRSEDLTFMENTPLALHEGDIGILHLTFSDPVVLERYHDFKELGRFLLFSGRKAFPGIVLQTTETSRKTPLLACGVSPQTLQYLPELVKQKRVSLLRVNGAFPLPDFNVLRPLRLPLALDIPGDRTHINKVKTTQHTDDELIKIAVQEGLDYISLSYVRDDTWLKEVRDYIASQNGTTKIIAKIETKEALQHLDAIAAVSDMLLIDRGDLGTDVGFEKVPFYQDKIIAVAKKHQLPVLVATELALSTINSNRPTYADAMQLYYFLRQEVDYIVLAEETTKNENPVASVQHINKILDFAEACF